MKFKKDEETISASATGGISERATGDKAKVKKEKLKPEPMFSSHNGAEYERLREDKVLRKKFDILFKPIFAEMKKGFFGDVCCDFVLQIYRSAISPAIDKLVSLKAEFEAQIEKLRSGGGITMIDNAETKFDKVIRDINSSIDSISNTIKTLPNLLATERASFVSEFKHESELYDQMLKTFSLAVVLLNTINNVKCLQNLQNLYSDDNEEKTINGAISRAVDEVRAFFNIICVLPKSEYADADSHIYTVKTTIEEYKKYSEAFTRYLRDLNEYSENHEKKCAARRNDDIEKLNALTARITPDVPDVNDKAIELYYGANGLATKYADHNFGMSDTTLTVTDIYQAYLTEKGKAIFASDLPVLSLEALGQLGLISGDAGFVWVLDDGYPVTDEIKSLFGTRKKPLIDKTQTLCFSGSAFNKLFEKNQKE